MTGAERIAEERRRQIVWEQKWWKPTPNDRVRELTKAGALIAAEIDRLTRPEEEKMTREET